MKDAKKTESIMLCKIFDDTGELIRIDTYVSLPITSKIKGATIWVHSSLCGAPSPQLCSLREFLETEEIQDDLRELSLSLILIDALHESAEEYIGVPEVGYIYKIH